MKGWLMLCAALLVTGWYGLSAPRPATEDIVYQSALGDVLPATLYRPLQGSPPYPVVLCIHSFWQSGVNAEPQAIELARHGFLAVTAPLVPHSDMAGRDRETLDFMADLEALCRTLRYRRDVRRDAMFAMGHSMGADLACALGAADGNLRGVVAQGFPVDANARLPRNLLIEVGAWDELHPLSEMQDALARATDDRHAVPYRTYGSQTAGTARELYVMPWSDHFMEPFDDGGVERSLAWMDGQIVSTRMGVEAIALAALVLGALGGFLILLCHGHAEWPLGSRPAAVALPGVLALGLAYRANPLPVWHHLILCLALAALMAGALGTPDKLRRGVHRAVGNGLAGLAVITAVYGLNMIPPITCCGPRAVGFLLVAPVFYCREAIMQAENVLFHTRADTTGISPGLLILLLLELAWPGGLVRMGVGRWDALVAWLQGLDLHLKAGASRGELALLGVVAAGGFFAWHQTLAAGYGLGSADVVRLLGILVRFAVAPLLLVPFVLRSRWYRMWR
ncbi:MAG TPA: hypothetical protein VGO93_31920 [Candidatus Xenobia bacterium]